MSERAKRTLPLGPPPIDTARLRLRPHEPADAERLAAAINYPEVSRNTQTIPHPYAVEDAHIYLSDYAQKHADDLACTWKIIDAADGALIGSVGLHIAEGVPDVEAGYWITPPRSGRGFATEALAAVVASAFDQSAIDRVHACFFVDNPASGRVLEKAGFWRCGLDERCGALGTRTCKAVLTEITREMFSGSTPTA